MRLSQVCLNTNALTIFLTSALFGQAPEEKRLQDFSKIITTNIENAIRRGTVANKRELEELLNPFNNYLIQFLLVLKEPTTHRVYQSDILNTIKESYQRIFASFDEVVFSSPPIITLKDYEIKRDFYSNNDIKEQIYEIAQFCVEQTKRFPIATLYPTCLKEFFNLYGSIIYRMTTINYLANYLNPPGFLARLGGLIGRNYREISGNILETEVERLTNTLKSMVEEITIKAPTTRRAAPTVELKTILSEKAQLPYIALCERYALIINPFEIISSEQVKQKLEALVKDIDAFYKSLPEAEQTQLTSLRTDVKSAAQNTLEKLQKAVTPPTEIGDLANNLLALTTNLQQLQAQL